MTAKIFTALLFLSSLFVHAQADTECPIVPKVASDRRENKNTLRLVQYNVEWLFMDYYKSSNCPGSGCPWVNETEASIHMSYVANVINTLNPDIINFCEVEGCDELNLLINALGKNNSAYLPYLKKGTDTATGQNVGMITKVDPLVDLYRDETHITYPISGSQCGYTGNSSSGVSKHYITEFALNDIKVAMIGAHFVAIPTEPSRCSQREAQAQVIQNNVFSYISKGYEIIVIGDMNDYDGEVLDINSHHPTSQVLDVLKGIKGDFANTYSLTTAASFIEKQAQRFTDWYDSDNNCDTASLADYSMIDHVLITPGLVKKITNVSIYHGYKEFCGKYNSDHYPVVIDFVA